MAMGIALLLKFKNFRFIKKTIKAFNFKFKFKNTKYFNINEKQTTTKNIKKILKPA